MSDFRISILPTGSVLYTNTIKHGIELEPNYQRMSDVWTKEKRQLLIDSLLNEFDIPKIYLHEFWPPLKKEGQLIKYAIIDGKQRLESIWKFIEGEFNLSEDFEYLHDKAVKASGLSYEELGKKYPLLKTKFDSTSLTIVTIQTKDIDLIEDMFSRLNEAVPLNAAEKRNAFGGPLPKAIKQICKHSFFTNKLPFKNKRYRHYDLAAKYLYVQYNKNKNETKFYDTKKIYLDTFVKEHKKSKEKEIDNLIEETKKVLNLLVSTFNRADKLLSSSGSAVVYYMIARDAIINNWIEKLERRKLVEFESIRENNRKLASTDIAKADYELLEYDRFSWSPNDGSSIDYRFKILKEFLLGKKKTKTER